MTTYNYSTFNDLLTTANVVTNGMFGGIIPFVIFIIVFGFTSVYGFNRAFATAGFISLLVAVPMYALGLTSGWIFVILIVLTLVGVFLNSR